MTSQDGVEGIRHKEVYVLRIGLMHIYYSIQFYYLLFFVIHLLFLNKLGDLLMYLSLSVMRCISAELSYVCQTVGVTIGKWLPNQATTGDTTSHTSFTKNRQFPRDLITHYQMGLSI